MKGIVAIVLKVDKDKEGSRSYDGGQYDTEKEINHSFKGDPLFPASPDSKKKPQDKTDGDEEPVSINVQTAQAKENGIHFLKSQISNSKHQTNSKHQFQMTKTVFPVSNLNHWNLFGIWCLCFGASFTIVEQQLNGHQADADGDGGIRNIESRPVI